MARRTAAEAAQTRSDLISAAVEVCAEVGFPNATLEAIAERASVTRGALYHHFNSKEELYDLALAELADTVLRPLIANLGAPDPPLERVHRFVASYCRALDTDPQFRRAVGLLLAGPTEPSRERTVQGFAAFLEAFDTVLGEAADKGDLRPGLSPRSAALSVLTCAAGVTTAALLAPAIFSPAAEADALAGTLVAGLRP